MYIIIIEEKNISNRQIKNEPRAKKINQKNVKRHARILTPQLHHDLSSIREYKYTIEIRTYLTHDDAAGEATGPYSRVSSNSRREHIDMLQLIRLLLCAITFSLIPYKGIKRRPIKRARARVQVGASKVFTRVITVLCEQSKPQSRKSQSSI